MAEYSLVIREMITLISSADGVNHNETGPLIFVYSCFKSIIMAQRKG